MSLKKIYNLFEKTIKLFLILILHISCAPIYIPNDVNAPLLSKEGEATLSLNYGTNGFNSQCAYAISDNIAFQLNMQNLAQDIQGENKQSFNTKDPEQNVDYYEAAVGFLKPLNETTIMEIYAGGGFGNASAMDKYNLLTSDKIYAEGEYYKYFLQADFGIKKEFLEGGLAIRLAEIHFTDLRFENYVFNGKPSSVFLESAIFLRLGGPNFKIKSQIGIASKLSKEKFVMYESMEISFGFIIRISSIL